MNKDKNDNWRKDKIDEIKKKKRNLRHVQDAGLVKKMKKDLKREYRSVKRSEKQWVDKQIDKKLRGEEDSD